MGQRELFLSLGAVILFGIIILNTNQRMVEQSDSDLVRQLEFYAISLAKSYLEEAKAKEFFDENLNGAWPQVPSGLTDPGSLGPEGELYPNFDDYDDFHGLVAVDSSLGINFYVTINVGYVEQAQPDSVVNLKTFYKFMSVAVTDSNYLSTPCQVGYVFGYMNLN